MEVINVLHKYRNTANGSKKINLNKILKFMGMLENLKSLIFLYEWIIVLILSKFFVHYQGKQINICEINLMGNFTSTKKIKSKELMKLKEWVI
jgi:hypothetical protein